MTPRVLPAQAFAMLMIKQGRLPGGVSQKDGEGWSFFADLQVSDPDSLRSR